MNQPPRPPRRPQQGQNQPPMRPQGQAPQRPHPQLIPPTPQGNPNQGMPEMQPPQQNTPEPENMNTAQFQRFAEEVGNTAKDTLNQTMEEVKSFGKETNFDGSGIPRTKEGIRVSLIAAFAFICGYFGGYTSLLLILGYALLIEKNDYITIATVKSLMLSIVFSIFYKVFSLPSDTLTVITDILSAFGLHIYFLTLKNILSILTTIVGWFEFLIFLMLSLSALRYKEIKAPFIENMFKKYF